MKTTKARRLLSVACGPALGVLLAVPVGGLLAGAAGADNGYPTAPPPPKTGITTSAGTVSSPNDGGVTTAPSSSGLAFTGADIEEMAVIGVVAIGVGTLLIRGRRRTA
jgi:hypothetical protein